MTAQMAITKSILEIDKIVMDKIVILLKKSFSENQKKNFAHRCSISLDRSLVNHFLHPEFS